MRTEALDFPKSILIETSNMCQGSCKFCPYKEIRSNHKIEKLDFEIYKKLIDEITNYKIDRLTLFNNNEPILDDRIASFIKYAHEKLPHVEITLSSNGIALTIDKIYELYNAGLTTLYVSIPTIDGDDYEKVMGFKPDRIINLLSKIDDKRIHKMIRIAVPKTKYFNHELMHSVFSNYLLCEWELEYKENWKIDDNFFKISDNIIYDGPCDRPMDQMVISSNGDAIICCRDWRGQNIIGNVYEKSLYNIWQSDKMKLIQAAIAKQEYDKIDCCKDCSLNKVYYLKRRQANEVSK